MIHYPVSPIAKSGPVVAVFIRKDGTTVLCARHDRGIVTTGKEDTIHFLPSGNEIGTEKFIRALGRLLTEGKQWDV